MGGLEGLHGELEGDPYMGLGTRVWVCEAPCVVFEGARVRAWGGLYVGLRGPIYLYPQVRSVIQFRT